MRDRLHRLEGIQQQTKRGQYVMQTKKKQAKTNSNSFFCLLGRACSPTGLTAMEHIKPIYLPEACGTLTSQVYRRRRRPPLFTTPIKLSLSAGSLVTRSESLPPPPPPPTHLAFYVYVAEHSA